MGWFPARWLRPNSIACRSARCSAGVAGHQLLSGRFETTTSVLADIAALGREKGVPVLFLIVPSDVQVERDRLNGYIAALKLDPAKIDADQPDTVLYKQLVARGADVVDALPALRNAADRGAHLYGQADPHLSAAGQEVLLNVIEPHLAALLKLGTHGSQQSSMAAK